MRRQAIAVLAAVAVMLAVGGNVAPAASMLTPGQSWDAAYDAAQPGDVIEVADGSYPSQSITGTKAAPGVTFHGGSGVTVDMSGQNSISADNIVFDGPMRMSWITSRNSDNVTFRGVTHTWFGLQSSTHTSLLGGQVMCPAANGYCDYDPQITNEYQSGVSPSDVLIDGVAFHDWRRPPGSDWHTECLQVGSGVRVTIRNSTFRRCATHDLFVRSWGAQHYLQGFVIENNRMYATDGGGFFTMQFEADLFPGGCSNNVARNNLIEQAFRPPTVPCITYQNNTLGPISDLPPPPPPPSACADLLDNDGDGLVDLNDPGCESSADTDEFNIPPPPPPTCDAACEQAYKDQIAVLNARVAALEDKLHRIDLITEEP